MQKLLSRKLWVTISTILGVAFQIQDPRMALVVGAVAIAYVVMQALVDKAEVENVARSVERGIAEARNAAAETGHPN